MKGKGSWDCGHPVMMSAYLAHTLVFQPAHEVANHHQAKGLESQLKGPFTLAAKRADLVGSRHVGWRLAMSERTLIRSEWRTVILNSTVAGGGRSTQTGKTMRRMSMWLTRCCMTETTFPGLHHHQSLYFKQESWPGKKHLLQRRTLCGDIFAEDLSTY